MQCDWKTSQTHDFAIFCDLLDHCKYDIGYINIRNCVRYIEVRTGNISYIIIHNIIIYVLKILLDTMES